MVNVYAQIAEKLLGVLEKFLDPKQYEIVRMKRMEKAINWAEKDMDNTDEIIKSVPENDDTKKLIRRHEIYRKKFQKYD